MVVWSSSPFAWRQESLEDAPRVGVSQCPWLREIVGGTSLSDEYCASRLPNADWRRRECGLHARWNCLSIPKKHWIDFYLKVKRRYGLAENFQIGIGLYVVVVSCIIFQAGTFITLLECIENVAFFAMDLLFGSPDPEHVIVCQCGKPRERKCLFGGLRNHNHFPPFFHLSADDDADPWYWCHDIIPLPFPFPLPFRVVCRPVRHWALVGQITRVGFVIRPRVMLSTVYAEQVPVAFHLSTSSPDWFGWVDLKVDSTLIILYAEIHLFLDGTLGVRQEASDTVMVFPATLRTLHEEYQAIQDVVQDKSKCFSCGKTSSSLPDLNLKRCTQCKIAVYCSRECQKAHWVSSHQKLCRHFAMLEGLAKLNFDTFHKHFAWRSADLSLLSPMEAMERLQNNRSRKSAEITNKEQPKPKRKDGGAQTIEPNTTKFRCSACQQEKPSNHFSKSQRRKPKKKMRCAECVHFEMPSVA